MKVKNGFISKRVGDADVVVAVGEMSNSFHSVITLKGIGAFVWKYLEKGTTEDEIVKAILEKYDVSEEIARRDVGNFIEKARSAGVLDD